MIHSNDIRTADTGRSFRSALALATVLAVGASAIPATAQDAWPMYQGNERHDGYLPITIEPSSLSERWSVQVSTSVLSACAVADGKVFTSGGFRGGSLHALSPTDGNELWSVSFPRAFSVNPPSFAHGNVYLQTCNHASDTWLRAYNATTGDIVFRAPHAAQWEQYGAPTIVDDSVYVNGGSFGGCYAFDAFDGTQRWFLGLAQYDEWTPAVDTDHAYAYVGGLLSAIDRKTGQVVYTIQDLNFAWAGWSMQLAPVLGGLDDLFVIHGRRLLRFDLLQQVVSYEIGGTFVGQPSIKDEVVYLISGSDLEARDQRTGALLWSWTSPGGALSSDIILTNEHAFVGNTSTTWMVDLAVHEHVWSIAKGGELAVGEGSLYIARSNGMLTAVSFTELPVPLDASPNRLHYTAAPTTVTIRGNGFARSTTPDVFFGSTQAQNVNLIDNYTLTCTSPVHGPGVVDIAVRNALGQRSMTGGFAYIPALQATGDFRPGGEIVLDHDVSMRDQMLSLVGIPPRVGFGIAPFAGQLEIGVPHVLVFIPRSLFESFAYRIPIPNDPSFSGAQLLFQTLSGPALIGGSAQAAWTNTESLTIQ